jgi:hypothetical protein
LLHNGLGLFGQRREAQNLRVRREATEQKRECCKEYFHRRIVKTARETRHNPRYGFHCF